MELADLAGELGAYERTLRRVVAAGTVRCERVGPRRQRVSEEERRWAVDHWPLVAKLRGALRTERNVRLAVIYGSVARGEDTWQSDVDILVSLAADRPDAAVRLGVRLERATGRSVDVARLDRVLDAAPLLLLRAVDEGRVIVDRDSEWPRLRERRGEIAHRANRAHAARRRRARASVRELLREAG
jgi:predicted nucleotidyltransferase